MVYSTENFYKTFESVRKLIPYKVCIKSIYQDEVLLRSSVKDLNETAIFVEAYETVTHSRFRVVPNKNSQKRHICRSKWICNHSVVSGTSENCPASISILIKKINKQNALKDCYLRRNPPHPAVIKIISNHNHPLMIPLSPFKVLKVNNGVKDCFYEYFKRGYYGARAKSLHEQYLRKTNFYSLEDESMNPSLPAIFTLYFNWLKMNGVDSTSDRKSSGSLQAPNIQKDRSSEIPQLSFENLEDFINMEDVLSRIKKEPEDDYTPTENIASEGIEDIKPVLNIKQEIIDEDENDGLPVISSYGSLVTTPSPALQLPQPNVAVKAEPVAIAKRKRTITTKTRKRTAKTTMQNVAAVVKPSSVLPPQSIVAAKAEPLATTKPKQIIATKSKPRTSKTSMQNVAAVVKVIQPSSSQVVVYDKSSNTYKVVKCLGVSGDTFAPSHCKSYLPCTLPARLSL